MTRFLSDLLRADEPLFTISLRQLESLSAQPAIDIQLMVEIQHQIRDHFQDLGLDSKTPVAVDQALKDRLLASSQDLASIIGWSQSQTTQQFFLLLKKTIFKTAGPLEGWYLKKTVAKKILIANPPLKTIEFFQTQTTEGLWRRHDVAEVMLVAQLVENQAWRRKIKQSYTTLKGNDFTNRRLILLGLTGDNWLKLGLSISKRQGHNLVACRELGLVGWLPTTKEVTPLMALTSLAFGLYWSNQVRFSGAFFKTQQVRFDFGDLVAQSVDGGYPQLVSLAGWNVDWPIIQSYFNLEAVVINPSAIFGPHIQALDLSFQTVGESLTKLEPSLADWQATNHLAVSVAGQTISANVLDLIVGLNLKTTSRHYYRQALWSELWLRYLQTDVIGGLLLDQLINPSDPDPNCPRFLRPLLKAGRH